MPCREVSDHFVEGYKHQCHFLFTCTVEIFLSHRGFLSLPPANYTSINVKNKKNNYIKTYLLISAYCFDACKLLPHLFSFFFCALIITALDQHCGDFFWPVAFFSSPAVSSELINWMRSTCWSAIRTAHSKEVTAASGLRKTGQQRFFRALVTCTWRLLIAFCSAYVQCAKENSIRSLCAHTWTNTGTAVKKRWFHF